MRKAPEDGSPLRHDRHRRERDFQARQPPKTHRSGVIVESTHMMSSTNLDIDSHRDGFPQGRLHASVYAEHCNSEEENFRRWIWEHEIPHAKLMNEMYVDSEDIWQKQRQASIEAIEKKRKEKLEKASVEEAKKPAGKRPRKRVQKKE